MSAAAVPAVNNRLKFEGSDAFFKAVRSRVDQYFRATGRRPRDCWQMYVKTAVILAWAVASYALLVFASSHWWQAVPLSISLARGESLAAT